MARKPDAAPTPQAETLVPKLIAATPFALATLGVLYDAGYFARIGLDFFPLFSLTEHLGFGLQGVPYLIVTLLCVYAAAVFTWSRAGQERNAKERKEGEDRVYKYLAIFFAVAGVTTLLFYPDLWPIVAFSIFGAYLFYFHFRNRTEGQTPAAVFIAGNFIIWIVGAFVAGYGVAAMILNPRDAPLFASAPVATISLNDGPSISGRVLRSGERGLLLLDKIDGTVKLKRWEEVRSIETPF